MRCAPLTRGLRRLRAPAACALLLAFALPARPETGCRDCHPDAAPAAGTVHELLECTDCHAGADTLPHPETLAEPACSDCHEASVAELAASAHARRRGSAALGAVACRECHGASHAILPGADPRSRTHPSQTAASCGACHADPESAPDLGFRRVRPLEAFEASVHARALARGEAGASCVDCHGSHAILPGADPQSRVNHERVAETCGACHAGIAAAYRESVHGRALAGGVREAPTCTDCHGEHRILSPREADSPVHATNIPKLTCGPCHGDLRIAEKFGLDPGGVPAFEDSFHGLSLRAGALSVAHCGSCHGVHEILPSSDPRSSVHAANLPATCGRCHPGAGTSFPIGRVHVLANQSEHAAVRVVRAVYLWVIYLTIGGMLLHNALDFQRKLRDSPAAPAAGQAPAGFPERMSRGFRVAHASLIVSFVLLAYSGFALAYPEAGWAAPLLRFEGRIALRGALHRAAAVLLLAALAFHLLHLVVDRRARACIAAMRPSARDLRELRERLAWSLGRRAAPPHTGTLGYPEKLEYLALLWGIGIMTASGLLLWSNDLVLRWLPKWVSDLATVVHFYEAVLASLAILVWHLYFVVFDPVVYPMDKAWLSGRSHPARARERGAQPAAPDPPPRPAAP